MELQRQGEALSSIIDSVFEQMPGEWFFSQYCIHLPRKYKDHWFTLWDVLCYYIPHYSPAAFCNLVMMFPYLFSPNKRALTEVKPQMEGCFWLWCGWQQNMSTTSLVEWVLYWPYQHNSYSYSVPALKAQIMYSSACSPPHHTRRVDVWQCIRAFPQQRAKSMLDSTPSQSWFNASHPPPPVLASLYTFHAKLWVAWWLSC